jgi:hypothetical protein
MAIITNIQPIDPNNFEFQDYNANDVNLVNEQVVETSFIQAKDYIEYHVYDLSNQLVFSEVGFNVFNNFRLLDNNLVLDPLQDIQNLALDGTYNAVYNFLTPLLGSNSSTRYYISEISSDRTEIRLDTTQIPKLEARQERTAEGTGAAVGGFSSDINKFIKRFSSSEYYSDFYLNFGENQLALAVNILLDESDPLDPTILIKLYEPLPPQFDLKTELWVVEKVGESVAFQVENTETFNLADLNIQLAGPNINLPVKDQINNSTEAQTLSGIDNAYTSSIQNQLFNVVSQSGASINIDYTEYENFVFFSSAQTRLNNFVSKLADLEQLEASASLVTSSLSSSILASEQIYRNQIKDIVSNFDGYEYFLYFTSGSKAWPKSNTTAPFSNVASSSAAAKGFYDSQSISASAYDEENINKLSLAIPEFVRDDPQNSQFVSFVEMVGQHFDSIKIYQDAVTEKYNTNPSLTAGLSKDLVGDAIKDFGLKLYQSSFTNQELYSYFLGVGTSGSIFPPTGSELITNYISASNDNIPVEDAIKGNYKKIYHALPSLLKRKGTLRGLRELINTFGVPDTVLRISEFGGKDKIAIDDYDYSENQFNFALQPTGTNGFIRHIFRDVNNDFPSANGKSPRTWALRINPGLLPTSSIPYSQSICIHREIFSSPTTGSFALVLEYSGPGYTTSSAISSSFDPVNPNYQYADLKFIVSGSEGSNDAFSASVSLPFYDGGWWSVMVRHEGDPVANTDVTYSLFAKNDIPTENGTQIGFQASSSVIARSWKSADIAYMFYPDNTSTRTIAGKTYTKSSTLQYQEIRWYALPLSESKFDNFVTNPYSIEGNTLEGDQSAQNMLIFRAPLGTMLDYDTPSGASTQYLSSSHPAATRLIPTASFEGGGIDEITYYYLNSDKINTIQNTERIYLDSPGVGIKSRNSDKVRAINLVSPTGSTLSQYITIEQSSPVSESYTPDVNYLEVGFSPSNELNDDIIAQFGNFNIGDFIGDPRQVSSSNTFYPDFNRLKDQYFEKFGTGSLVGSPNIDVSYNVYDFIRLAKFFDNSLFKMIKDFVPARTSLSTGVVVKPHILERTKYPQPQTSFEELLYTGSVKSFPLGYQTGSLVLPIGGNGGSFNNLRSLKAFPGNLDLFLTRVTGLGASVENLTPLTNFLTLIGGNDELEFSNTFNQSFTYSVTTPSGSLIVTQSDAREFFNGEFSGSQFTVEDGELNPDNPFKKPSKVPVSYHVIFTSGSTNSVNEGTASINYEVTNPALFKYQFNSITFNNIDENGVDQQLTFANIQPPNDINFRITGSNNISRNVTGVGSSVTKPSALISIIQLDTKNNPVTRNSLGDFAVFHSESQNFQFDPYLPGVKFDYNDNNALLGNATQDRESSIYFDADYSTSQLSAVNLQNILSGSATRAQTPDSNYSLARSIRPRYEGSKNTDSTPLEILSIVLGQPVWTKNLSFDRQLIQSTSSLAPLNNYISAIVEYEDISISGSTNKLQNERVPNNIIFIESKKPGQAIFQSTQTQTNLDEEGKLALVEGISDFSTLSKGDPSFFPTIQQIFKEGDSVNLLSYEASSIVASGSIPLVTRTVAGFSSSIETIVFEDKRPFPTALLPTGKGAIFSTFSSPVINRNIIDITKKLGNNS